VSDEIRVLELGETIRRRPGLFLAHREDQDGGVHDLLWELVGNVIDLHTGRLATELHVDMQAEGWGVVRDDGPGIPVSDSRFERPILELVFMGVHGGVSMATRGMNLEHTPTLRGEVVNALSMRTEVETTRDGVRWAMAFERGNVVETLRDSGAATNAGTLVRFLPDPTIFRSTELDLKRIEERLQQLAWVRPLLRVVFQGRRLHGRGGLRGWANQIAGGTPEALFATDLRVEDVYVDLAIAWKGKGEPRIHSFVNARPTPGSGTHVDGLWGGLTACAAHARAAGHGQLAPGLIAIINVELDHAKFRDATHDALSNTEVAKAVESVVCRKLADADHLGTFFEGRLGSKPAGS
jgi:DNA gyrase subunit B